MKKLLTSLVATSLLIPLWFDLEVSSALGASSKGHESVQVGSTDGQSISLRVKLLSPLSTKTNRKGDRITSQVIAPDEFAGDFLEGVVTKSKSGKKIKGTSELAFVFHTLVHKGETIPVQAFIQSYKNSKGQEQAEQEGVVVEKKNNIKKLVLASILSAGAGILVARGTGSTTAGAATAGALALILIKVTAKGANMSFDPGSEFVVEVQREVRG
jgi:hypothetical protein